MAPKRRFRRPADAEIREEIRGHLRMAIQERIDRGEPPEEARRAAMRELGNAALVAEDTRAVWIPAALDRLRQDLAYTGRWMRRSPGFTTVAVLTLALGVGASTAIFSIAEAVLLRPLPYPDPRRIVRVWEQAPDGHAMNFSDPDFDDFHDQNHTFSALAVFSHLPLVVAGGARPLRLEGAAVSREFFAALGVAPAVGRPFSADERQEHGAPAAIVSHGYWQRELGGGKDLAGLHLRLEGKAVPVVGVMPEGFDFPPGTAVWVPRELWPALPSRTAHNWRALGRLREGATLAQARDDLGAIAHRIRARYGDQVDLDAATVVPLSAALVGDVRPALLTLLGAVGLLLLVASANVAGLLLARTAGRRGELAVRAALGAGRGRLLHQLLAESLALSAAGGAVGTVLAGWAVHALPALLPESLPRRGGVALDGPVLLFALGTIVAVGLGLGLLAAGHAASDDLRQALTAGGRGRDGAVRPRLRAALVVGEIATTLVILVGAGLLGRSFLRLLATSPGFSARDLITVEFSPPLPPSGEDGDRDPGRQVEVVGEVLARLRALPGVSEVGLVGAIPAAAGDNLADGDFLILDGREPPTDFAEFGRLTQNPARVGHALYCVADGGYLRAMGIPLLRGRTFDRRDGRGAPHVAVISQALARQRWPDRDPIGQVIEFGNMDGDLRPLTIVGIAGDVRTRGLDLPPSPVIYVDYRQRGLRSGSSPTIVLRGTATVGEIARPVRQIFHDLAPDSPVRVSTFAERMGGWLAARRFLLLLVGAFAAAGLALAAIGLYGVVAFFVVRRRAEIGIRMALGAERRDVLRLVLGEGARLAGAGIALGVAVSLLLTRLVGSLLFGVRATDPWTFGGVAALLTLVALGASALPARRAARVDPVTALR